MGGTSSKHNNEPIMIYNEPEVRLRQFPQSPSPSSPTSTTSTICITTDKLEEIIRERVAAELRHREEFDTEIQREIDAELSRLFRFDDHMDYDPRLHSKRINEEIENLEQRIRRSFEVTTPTTVIEHQRSLIRCYTKKENINQPLNCAEQVEKFKASVEQALRV
ncbi:6546_t:CDS:2 [Ambispora leptoticha]|uniref:6546_t:CDS:1 n=1 Tax=Ambispora leptoticha TaxID=144679 RepID=A0A9N8YRN2_9GLOM|nr:6546_t:CDS:2 [Ambispora leptoticha]